MTKRAYGSRRPIIPPVVEPKPWKVWLQVPLTRDIEIQCWANDLLTPEAVQQLKLYIDILAEAVAWNVPAADTVPDLIQSEEA